jgi:hypothetical protein
MAEKKPVVTCNGKSYFKNDLSDEARNQLQNVRATEAEIKRLQMQVAIAQTARNAYQMALVQALEKSGE